MRKRRTLCAILAILMLFAITPLNVSATPGPTDYTFTLQAGKNYEITNSSTENVDVRNYSDYQAYYDIVWYNAAGNVSGDNRDRGGSNGFTIGDRGKVRITTNASLPLNLYVSSGDSGKINVNEVSYPAYHYFTLQKGRNYEITNSSTGSFDIKNFSDYRANYDIVWYNSAGNVSGDARDRGGSNGFTIGDRGKIRITTNDTFALEGLYVIYEDWAKLTITESSTPAFYFFTLQKGRNYEITNSSTGSFDIKNFSDYRADYDIVWYNSAGNVSGDARDRGGSNGFTIGDRGKIRITTNDTFALEGLYVIYEDWAKLTINETTMPAFYFFTLQTGQNYVITNSSTDNIDVKNYADYRADYDIVWYNSAGNISSEVKGRGGANGFMVSSGGKVSVSTNAIFPLDLFLVYEVAPKLTGIPTPPGGYAQNTLTPYGGGQQPPTTATPGYVYDSADPGASVNLPTDLLPTVTDRNTAVSATQAAVSGMTTEQKQSATGIDLVTLFAEEAVAQAAGTTFSGGVVINQSSLQSLQTTSNEVKAAAEQALAAGGVTTQREMQADVKFMTYDSAVTITIEPSAANTTADNVRVETPDYSLSFSAESIKANTGDGPLVITIVESGGSDASSGAAFAAAANAHTSSGASTWQMAAGAYGGIDVYRGADTYNGADTLFPGALYGSIRRLADDDTKTYSITFNKPVDEDVKVSIPPSSGDPNYQAVTNSKGEAVGGKYNPITKKLEVRISVSDTYTVKNNKKSFSDISSKSAEMQNAINVLASKGIINGTTATTFSPDSAITRAEIAALIVRTLAKLDPNADGGFTDVRRTDWYFGAVGSAKIFGIVNGTSPTTFSPRSNIQKDQIVAICARTLREVMGYRNPSNISGTLSIFNDAGSIAAWGREDIALATRENLVVYRTDGTFGGGATMTRGDAAIILYRMFMKIW